MALQYSTEGLAQWLATCRSLPVTPRSGVPAQRQRSVPCKQTQRSGFIVVASLQASLGSSQKGLVRCRPPERMPERHLQHRSRLEPRTEEFWGVDVLSFSSQEAMQASRLAQQVRSAALAFWSG